MPVNPALAITIPASSPRYRITAISFHTPNPVHHRKVVNGMGAQKSHNGARYNYGGVLTVFLADTVETCLAEKMFYFHRETLRRFDALHLPLSLGVPLFSAKFTLWEIRLKKAIPAVCHLTQASASAFGVFPSLMLNPSQDYEHLKDRRAFLESNGYSGIQAPSSRSVTGGDKIQELIDKHFKFYKQINDDDKFSRFFLDWLFERYLKRAQEQERASVAGGSGVGRAAL